MGVVMTRELRLQEKLESVRRDKVFELNKLTRTGLKQKYSREQILTETTFVSDIRQWQINRATKGATALEEAGKPYRFKKGGNHAS